MPHFWNEILKCSVLKNIYINFQLTVKHVCAWSPCYFFYLWGTLSKHSTHLLLLQSFSQIFEPFMSHKSKSLPTPASYKLCFPFLNLLWEEAGVSRQSPHKLRESIQAPHRGVLAGIWAWALWVWAKGTDHCAIMQPKLSDPSNNFQTLRHI